ncbi:MAG: holo-[acyl-carrier-protein] synthase [Candidatus Eisenbacteria bacterium]|nr:holo-[acyl-carrier-protein] synthase [Candidatus Eisenbacteria bacterium]
MLTLQRSTCTIAGPNPVQSQRLHTGLSSRPGGVSLVIGIGVDIVDLGEFRARLTDELARELFVETERAYAATQARPWEALGARFAAKEAAMKALGHGLEQGLRWHDIRVEREPSGRADVVLGGRARRRADELGVTRALLSISHTRGAAVAVVLLEM